jgi:epoxyqueuosine reductase
LNDDEPVIRGACAWALGRFQNSAAENALKSRHRVEADSDVLAEIQSALELAIDHVGLAPQKSEL